MLTAAVLILAAFAPAQAEKKNEAEELFRKSEEKVFKAKVVEYESEVVLEGAMKGTMSLKAVFAEGNKGSYILEFVITYKGGPDKNRIELRSDGKKLFLQALDGNASTVSLPKEYARFLITVITRVGTTEQVWWPGADLSDKKQFDLSDYMKVRKFKLGKKEKVGDIEAQAIEYEVHLGRMEYEEWAHITVWIDLKTDLPVKRVMTRKATGETIKLTEKVKTFKLDGKVDDKVFELPRE